MTLPPGSAAAMIARWTEAYSLADENAASARVRLIISGLLVACAMSCERLSSEVISWLYWSIVLRLGEPSAYAVLRIVRMSPSSDAIWATLAWMPSSASSPWASPMAFVASKNASLARSVFFRGSVTL